MEENVAEKDGSNGSVLINLGIEDVNNDLEENFEIGSLEDLFEGEDIADDAKKAGGEDMIDVEEMFTAADNSVEKADNDSEENVANDTATVADESKAGDEAAEEEEPSQGDAGSANDGGGIEVVNYDQEENFENGSLEDASTNDVGGTAIFDSIDLVRQAVEFLTVSR